VSSGQQKKHESNKGNLTMIILTIIILVVMILAQYDEIAMNIFRLTNAIGIPIMLILKIIGIILLLYWLTYFLLKFIKKQNQKKLKQPTGIYKSSFSELPPEIEIIKIIKFIIKHTIIKHSILVNDLGYSDIKATHYLSQLFTNNFIQEAPFLNHRIKDGNYTFFKDGEIKYVIGKNGREFAINHNLD
jgi:hypothetical protein